MNGFLRGGKNLIWLFVCGFFIGIILEVLLLEKQKLGFISSKESQINPIKVTCLVLQKHQHKRYIKTSKVTWLQHCDDYYILHILKPQKPTKDDTNETTPSNLNEFEKLIKNNETCLKEEGKFKNGAKITANSSWSGLCKSFHIIKPKLNHWLIIVPDSLVVIIENLKLLVKNLNYNEDYYLGYAIEHYSANFNSLSAGILLSRWTVLKILEKFKTVQDCDLTGKYWRNEDLYLGIYLKEMEIFPKDTRDEKGRGKFHGYNLNNLLWPRKLFLQSDYSKKALYPVPQGFNCCSPFLVTMDVSDADAMQNLYYFLYKLKTGHFNETKKINYKPEKEFNWKDFLREEGYSETQVENMTDEEYYKIWEKKLPLDTVYKEMKSFAENHEIVFDK